VSDLVTNAGKGRLASYAVLPGADDVFVAVVLEAAALPSDDVLQDYPTLAALLAGPASEHAAFGRPTLTGVTVTADDTANTVSVSADDVAWPGPSGAATGKLVVCYAPTAGSPDTALVPLLLFDFAVTLKGQDVVARPAAEGLAVLS
jgi:hypothetical protein